MSDDWAPVKQAAADDDWMAVAAPKPETSLAANVPSAFLDRVRAGQALSRIWGETTKGASEGFGNPTPTGLEDETLNHLIDLGIFHDPAKSRGGPIQMANEAVMIPTAKAFDTLMRGIAGGIHAAGGGVGQLVEEFGGSQGTANRAKNEVINAGNWALIEGGMGRFSRPSIEPQLGVVDKVVGGLPVEGDFVAAGKALDSPHAEGNLRRAWQEDGIHPAEAVHDADRDAFLKHDLTAYHGSPVSFSEFSPSGPYYFTSDAATAGEYAITSQAETAAKMRGEKGFVDPDKAPHIVPAFLKMDNPYKVDLWDLEKSANARNPDWLRQNGYDSAIMEDARNPANTEYVVLNREQIQPKYGMPSIEDIEVLTETGGKPGSLGAAATLPGDIPLDIQPASPPGNLAASFQNAAATLLDIGRDTQMLVAPMARGTTDSMAIAKDFANSMRRNRWDWDRIDTDIAKRFTPEQRARMWTAADEESTSLQLKEPGHMREHQGLSTLDPVERAAVDELQTRAQNAWVRARDLGMVEGEGLPAYTPRMIINAAGASSKEAALALNSIGGNLKTKTANMLRRKYLTAEETEAAAKAKYGDEAALARDIRVLPMATAHLEDAIAGRSLINNIKDYGARTGADTVVEGAIPAGSETKWFTLDHPAFRTWRPKLEYKPNGEPMLEGNMLKTVKDADGHVVFEQVPLYVHGDFEGPLRAVLTQRSGALYGAAMSLKGKTMSLIMNSPMIHNAVEWGRALPAMPGKVLTFKVYFEGNRAKHNVEVMHEAIDAGLVPIGHRFFNQDISGMMESPNLTPGRSSTSQILAVVPGLFDEAAGTAVKKAIDKAGDFWHNTLLWDRVADLQMGLYVNMKADAIAKGIDPQTSARLAAHWANRYAGALPKEAMSDAATKVSNMLLFSRSFTMGNLGVIKDMLTGLPKDVLAQIERDMGVVDPAAKGYAKSLARRKAMSVVVADMALLYIGNSLMQNVFNVLTNDSTLDKELHGYATRFQAKMQAVKEHPLELVQPLRLLQDLGATSDNEPSKQERIHVGAAANGTAIYMRQPAGKIGEEFVGYMTGPLDMMRKKLGTIARPVWQIMSNDAGFGRKVYDPDADTPGKYLANLGRIAAHLAKSQLPEGQINAFSDLVKGEGDAKVNTMQAFGPFAGVTFSKGAPGGPAVGEMYASRAQHDFKVNQALPDIRRQIQRGDIAGAQDRMMELDIPVSLQRFYIKTTLDPATRMSPRATRDFYLHATPEQRARFDRARQAPQQP